MVMRMIADGVGGDPKTEEGSSNRIISRALNQFKLSTIIPIITVFRFTSFLKLWLQNNAHSSILFQEANAPLESPTLLGALARSDVPLDNLPPTFLPPHSLSQPQDPDLYNSSVTTESTIFLPRVKSLAFAVLVVTVTALPFLATPPTSNTPTHQRPPLPQAATNT